MKSTDRFDLSSLDEGCPVSDLRPEIDRVLHHPDTLDMSGAVEIKKLHEELRALVTIILREDGFWDGFVRFLKEHEPHETAVIQNLQAMRPGGPLNAVAAYLKMMKFHYASAWEKQRLKAIRLKLDGGDRLGIKDPLSDEDRRHVRAGQLASVWLQSHVLKSDPLCEGAPLADFIGRGYANALNIICGLIALAAELHERQWGRISQNHYRAWAHDASLKKMLLELSDKQLDRLMDFTEAVSSKRDDCSYFIMDPDCFTLVKDKEGTHPFSLQPTSRVNDKLRRTPLKGKKTRCPAYHARLIIPTLEQVLGLLDKYYFPEFSG